MAFARPRPDPNVSLAHFAIQVPNPGVSLARRFAYHLRQWQIEGTGISSHLKALSDKQSLPLRIVCQPAGLPDKVAPARAAMPLQDGQPFAHSPLPALDFHEWQKAHVRPLSRPLCAPPRSQMTIEMYPSDQVADLRAEVTHWYENLQKEQMNQQAQLQEFGQSSRQGDFPGQRRGRRLRCHGRAVDSVTSLPGLVGWAALLSRNVQ